VGNYVMFGRKANLQCREEEVEEKVMLYGRKRKRGETFTKGWSRNEEMIFVK